MVIFGVILLVALLIPVLSIVLDSPVGRAVARRMEGPEPQPTGLRELAQKVELLEHDVDDLSREVEGLKEENAFLQRLLEDQPRRPTLPPAENP